MSFRCARCGKKVDADTAEVLAFLCPTRPAPGGPRCGGELKPLASPLDGLAVDDFPYPIALTAARLKEAADDGRDALRTLFLLKDCFEATVKFLAAVLLADYHHGPTANEERNRALVRSLMRPSLGHWVNEVVGRLATWQAPGDSPGNRIAALFFSARKGGGTTATELWEHCGQFVQYRNDALGHGALRSEEAYQADLAEWLPRGRRLLDGVATLAPWQLTLVAADGTSQPWTGLDKGPPGTGGAAPSLSGRFVLLRPDTPPPSAETLARSPPAFRQRELAPLLCLAPDPAGTPRLHFFDSVYRYKSARKEATVLEYDGGHRHPCGEPVAALERVFTPALLAEVFQWDRGRMEVIEGRVAHFGELLEEHATIVGRRFAVDRVRRFVADNDRGLLVIEGRPGQGKTALMAHLVEEVFGDRTPPPVAFFFRRTAGITDLTVCFRSLFASLLEAHGVTEAEESRQKNTPEEVVIKLSNLLNQQVAARLAPGRPQLLFIDALDESERSSGSASAYERLPESLPANVFVIVSTRPAEEETALARRRNVHWLRLDAAEFDADNAADGLSYVTQELEAVPAETRAEISRVGAGNFLVLKLLCRHIRSALRPDEVSAFLNRLATDGSQDHLGFIYEEFWRRLASRCGLAELNLLCDVAGVLVSAQAPLDRAVVCGVLGLRAGDWDFALRRLVEFLSITRPSETPAGAAPAGASFYRLYHESFADFLRAKVGHDLPRLRSRFADYCRGWRQFPEGYARTYALRFAPAHLGAAGRDGELVELLSDVSFLETKARASMVFDLAEDFARATALVPPRDPGRRRLLLLEEALRAELHFIARHPSALPQCLYNLCWWFDGPDAAAHYPDQAGGLWLNPDLASLFDQPPADPEGRSEGAFWLRAGRPPPLHLDGPQRAVFEGHADGVETVDVSWDGRQLASAGGNDGKDTAIRVWDLARGTLLRTLRGHTGLVHRIRFARDGTRLVSASADTTVRLWDLQRGELLRCLSGHTGNVDCVAIAPAGDYLLSGSRDGTVRLWPLLAPDRPPRLLAGGQSQARGVAFHPTRPVAAAGLLDHTVRLWDIDSGAPLHVLRGHTAPVYTVAFSPDGTLLASGSRDRTVRLWDVETGAAGHTLRGHGDWVYSVAFAPAGERLASGSRDQTVRVWDVSTGQALLCLRGHQGAVYSVAFRRPDGAELASGSRDSVVRVWNLVSAPPPRERDDHRAPLRCLAFAPDGTCLVSGAGHVYLADNSVRVWDPDTGLCRLTLEGHNDNVLCVAATSGGQVIASGARDKTLRLWDGRSGRTLHCLEHPLRVESVALTADGRRLASGCLDGRVRVWELPAEGPPRLLRVFDGQTLLVRCLGFLPDGRLASGSPDGTVWLWDVEGGTGRRLAFGLGRVRDLAVSADGREIACAADVPGTQTQVWETEGGTLRATLPGCGDVRAVAGHFPFRSRIHEPDSETVIEEAKTGTAVAWFPVALRLLTPHPDPGRRLWAGVAGQHLFLIELRRR